MELALGAVALVVGGIVVVRLLRRRAQAGPDAESSHARPSVKELSEGGTPSGPGLHSLSPGDVVLLADGRTLVVESVLECGEELHGRSTFWRWSLLSEGTVLEAAPDGNVLYDRAEVVHQGEQAYESLVGPDGVLRLFEERVRAGVVGSQPVSFEHCGVVYRVASTGTFLARPVGVLPEGEVWRDISSRPGDNVYFEMEAPDGHQVLGIWTTHILLLYGHPVDGSEIVSVYPGSAASDRA